MKLFRQLNSWHFLKDLSTCEVYRNLSRMSLSSRRAIGTRIRSVKNQAAQLVLTGNFMGCTEHDEQIRYKVFRMTVWRKLVYFWYTFLLLRFIFLYKQYRCLFSVHQTHRFLLWHVPTCLQVELMALIRAGSGVPGRGPGSCVYSSLA